MTCPPILIVEGADGTGKSTLVDHYRKTYGSLAICHHGTYPDVWNRHLGRFYFESMTPAFRGHRPVVLDRSWLSEPIYGSVCRSMSRIDAADLRTLDRAAWRGGARVIVAQRGLGSSQSSAAERPSYPDLEQLERIWEAYRGPLPTSLRVETYNWEEGDQPPSFGLRHFKERHPTWSCSAGNIQAPTVLVIPLHDHSNFDSAVRLPGVTFDRRSRERWLTEALDEATVEESELCWFGGTFNVYQFASLFDWEEKHWVVVGEVRKDFEAAFKAAESPLPPKYTPVNSPAGAVAAIMNERWKEMNSAEAD